METFLSFSSNDPPFAHLTAIGRYYFILTLILFALCLGTPIVFALDFKQISYLDLKELGKQGEQE